jgi:hypothetical protein
MGVITYGGSLFPYIYGAVQGMEHDTFEQEQAEVVGFHLLVV